MADKKNPQPRMDDSTALGYAIYKFEEIHPRVLWPEWLMRCTVDGISNDKDKNYIVSFCVTPLATKLAESYFRVRVNAYTGETEVLEDQFPLSYKGSELGDYDKS